MKALIPFAIGLLVATTLPSTHAAGPLPRSAPEAQGVSSSALLDLVNALDQQIEGMHSLMILRHGKVVAEGWWKPYDAAHNHVLYSLSTWKLKFDGDRVTLNSEANVAFGSTKRPQLIGRAE